MKKFFYSLIVIIILVSAYLVLQTKPLAVETVVIQQDTFYETFSSDGKIRSRNKQTVYALASGNVEKTILKVGDAVKKGQVITHLIWDRNLQVKSPIDGIISKLFHESEGPVQRGEPLFEVSSVTDLEVVAELLTPDAVRLNPKSEVKILNWGGKEELSANISQISRAGMIKTSALGVEEERTEVKLSFQKVPEELKNKFGDNYHVDVVFIVSKDENAISVPLGALFKNKDAWSVYLIKDGRAKMQEIEISKKNDKHALVTKNLNVGDQVILFPGDKVFENSRVKSTVGGGK